MKKRSISSILIGAAVISAALSGCGSSSSESAPQTSVSAAEESTAEESASEESGTAEADAGASIETNGGEIIALSDLEHENENAESVVYFTSEISPEAMTSIYHALGEGLSGEHTAVKLSTGEPPASNYLDPNLIADLVHEVNGTIVENNTAYGGQRASTAMHYQVAEDHGFASIADFVVLDEDGSVSLPVEGGTQLTENLVGAHFPEYDGYLVLSHFKGHAMAGFGGAIKNISIGMASQEGKCLIHTAGESHTSPWGGEQDPFTESMAEAGKSVVDTFCMSALCTTCLLTVTAMAIRQSRTCTIWESWPPQTRWRWIRPVWTWSMHPRMTQLPSLREWSPAMPSMSWSTGRRSDWETEITAW